jgi:hypothetical protein
MSETAASVTQLIQTVNPSAHPSARLMSLHCTLPATGAGAFRRVTALGKVAVSRPSVESSSEGQDTGGEIIELRSR